MADYSLKNTSSGNAGRGFKLLGVGSPLLDILVRVDDAFLSTVPGEKGGMMMVDAPFQQELLSRLPDGGKMAPGGSAGNTVFMLARLGIDCAMFGKLGKDANGDFYRQTLRGLGGSDREFVITADAPTGTCLSMITPDAERTMRSHLGASLLICDQDVERVDFSAYDLVYIEGYMLYSPIMPTLLRRAKAAGCRIGLDLAAFEVVRAFRAQLPEMLRTYVDIVVANEDEAGELFGAELGEAEQLDALAELCPIAALKLGARGSMLRCGTEKVTVPALRVTAVDTTAAGDLWAAGFLHGLITGKSLENAAADGSLVAAEVVKVIGSELPPDRVEYVKQKVCR